MGGRRGRDSGSRGRYGHVTGPQPRVSWDTRLQPKAGSHGTGSYSTVVASQGGMSHNCGRLKSEGPVKH